MLLNTVIAIFIILITVVIHSGGMQLVLVRLQSYEDKPEHRHRRHIFWVGSAILVMFVVSLLEVVVWAVTYMSLNAVQSFEEALYFSMVTFTTLGYGDVTLDAGWRLLSAFEAANGIIMFGWTTAIVIAVVQRVHTRPKK